MILSRRAEQRLLEAAKRASGDASLDAIERYRVRPWVGGGLTALGAAALVVGVLTGEGWFAFVFLGTIVLSWFVDRRVTVAAGPNDAYVFLDTAWGPSIGSNPRVIGPGDVDRVTDHHWRVAGHDLWSWSPATALLERVAARTA